MILGTATALGPGSRPALANPPEVTTVINHFETSQHFEADLVCGGLGVTEFANVAEHLHVVDQGDMLHVVYREAFSIPEVYDDPTIPDGERQGTHALTFQLVNNGAGEGFHESFHDKPSTWGDTGCLSSSGLRIL